MPIPVDASSDITLAARLPVRFMDRLLSATQIG